MNFLPHPPTYHCGGVLRTGTASRQGRAVQPAGSARAAIMDHLAQDVASAPRSRPRPANCSIGGVRPPYMRHPATERCGRSRRHQAVEPTSRQTLLRLMPRRAGDLARYRLHLGGFCGGSWGSTAVLTGGLGLGDPLGAQHRQRHATGGGRRRPYGLGHTSVRACWTRGVRGGVPPLGVGACSLGPTCGNGYCGRLFAGCNQGLIMHQHLLDAQQQLLEVRKIHR